MAFGLGKIKNIFAGNPGKEEIKTLAYLLEQVDGSLKIAKASYQEDKDCLTILYGIQGIGNFTTKSAGGWDLFTYLVNPDNFKNPGSQQTIDISGKTYTANNYVVKQYQKVISNISNTINARLANSATPPNGVVLKLQSNALTEPIGDIKNDPEVILSLINQKTPYKYSIKPLDLLENDRRTIFFYIFYDYIRFIGRHPINQSQSLYRTLNLPSGRDFQNMLKIGLRKLKIIEVLDLTESEFDAHIDNYSRQVVRTNREGVISFEIKRGYIFGSDKTNTYFSINGLHLAVACFALLEEPKVIPLQMIIEIIKEYGKPEILAKLTSVHNATVFMGEEVKFIESLITLDNIEDGAKKLSKTKRNTLKDSINKLKSETGEDLSAFEANISQIENHQVEAIRTKKEFNEEEICQSGVSSEGFTTQRIKNEAIPETLESNELEESEVLEPSKPSIESTPETTEPLVKNKVKTDILKSNEQENSLSKFEVLPSETNISDEIMMLQEMVKTEQILYTPNNIAESHSDEPIDELSATLGELKRSRKVNHLFSYTTEKEINLRLQDLAKDITVQMLMEQNKKSQNFTKEVVRQINNKTFSIVQEMYYNTYLFKKDGHICIYSNQEEMFDKPLNKKIYIFIMKWRDYKESRFKKMWGLPSSAPKEFNRDISNKLIKILKLKDIFELDKKFKNNEFYLRYTDKGITTCIHESTAAKDIIETVNMNIDKEESSFTANPINDIKNSVMTHWYQYKGDNMFRCDVTRVLDFLYDLAFFYNSENRNNLPDQKTFDMLKRGIRDLEAMGLIKRKLIENYLITIIPKKIPNNLDSDKYQILDFFQKIGEKYKDIQYN